MSILLYNVKGEIIDNPDLQNKHLWCKIGEKEEHTFVKDWGKELGYIMNPEKQQNKYAPDLLCTISNTLTDLKSQFTPFFTAKNRYNIEPQYAVTFNCNDAARYTEEYPHIDILYHLKWIAVKARIYGKEYKVEPFEGIYRISFREFLTILERAQIHPYDNRKNDHQKNAKDSYVIDIRNPLFQRLK